MLIFEIKNDAECITHDCYSSLSSVFLIIRVRREPQDLLDQPAKEEPEEKLGRKVLKGSR